MTMLLDGYYIVKFTPNIQTIQDKKKTYENVVNDGERVFNLTYLTKLVHTCN